MSRQEKRDETAVLQAPLLVLAVTFIGRELGSPDRFAKISFGCGFSAFEILPVRFIGQLKRDRYYKKSDIETMEPIEPPWQAIKE